MDEHQALTSIGESNALDLAVATWLHAHGKRWNKEEQRFEHTRTSKAYEDSMQLFR